MEDTSPMKHALLFCFVASLAGCCALDSHQTTHYRDYGLSDSMYAKIHAHQRLTVPDVVELSDDHVHSSDIMAYLALTGQDFALSDADVENLRREHVSGDVITYMRENPNHTGGLLTTFSPDFYAQIGSY